jgi:hypothetical protein
MAALEREGGATAPASTDSQLLDRVAQVRGPIVEGGGSVRALASASHTSAVGSLGTAG